MSLRYPLLKLSEESRTIILVTVYLGPYIRCRVRALSIEIGRISHRSASEIEMVRMSIERGNLAQPRVPMLLVLPILRVVEGFLHQQQGVVFSESLDSSYYACPGSWQMVPRFENSWFGLGGLFQSQRFGSLWKGKTYLEGHWYLQMVVSQNRGTLI